MPNINVTLSIDKEVYEKYREYCKENAIALSRSVEKYMEKSMARWNPDE